MKNRIALLLAFALAVTCLLFLLVGSLCAYLSTGQWQLTPSLSEIITIYQTDQNALLLFLALSASLFLLLGYLLLARKKEHKSLRNITNMVSTPEVAGHQQHGSARWLREKEYGAAFDCAIIDPSDLQIKQLMEEGVSDLIFPQLGGEPRGS
ncbi:hypothetical protein LJC20_05110 [Eubacteriales bacterium OttesenSCG-928-M02]|nr:hypothetical protein [Eubacteriales bacterium OttesenSCG-928-M02]